MIASYAEKTEKCCNAEDAGGAMQYSNPANCKTSTRVARKTCGALRGRILKISDKLLDLVFPKNLYCLCCGDTVEQSRVHGICDSCAEKINWLTKDPFSPVLGEYAFCKVMACCVYGYLPRKIMYAIKLHERPYAAENAGRLMADRLLEDRCNYDILIPVPMTEKKRRLRGYNQTELLAAVVSRICKIPMDTEAIAKLQETPSMRTSSGEARRNLLCGVFSTGPAAEKLKDADVVLVDDVITTGSTADACAREILAAGAKSVSLLCFASTAYPAHAEDEAEAAVK